MKNSKFSKGKVLIWVVILITLPLLLFVINFKNVPFSRRGADWSEFATYWSVFISLANLFVFIYFTFEIHSYTRSRDKLLDNFEKPVISFSKLSQLDRYTIVNVGKGPALNIFVKSNLNADRSRWRLEKILYSFAAGKEKEMDWTTDCNALCALYEDILGHKYISFMEDDRLTFIDEYDEVSKGKHILTYNLSQNKAEKTEWFS